MSSNRSIKIEVKRLIRKSKIGKEIEEGPYISLILLLVSKMRIPHAAGLPYMMSMYWLDSIIYIIIYNDDKIIRRLKK